MVVAATKTRLSEKPRMRVKPSGSGRAYFDAAATNRLNENHWLYATDTDINSLIRTDLSTLRKRARFEILNNSYGAGIADTLAFDVVGEGPRLQLDSGNPDFDAEAEEKFMIWARDCDFAGQMDLAELLQMQLVAQQCEAGESLTAIKRDPTVGPYDVSLRLLTIETERLESPMDAAMPTAKLRDGIAYDDHGRPVNYYILKDHPYGNYVSSIYEFDIVQASQIIHLFRIKRPGQSRGIPWFTPALPLFADLRDFTLSTIKAARNAADPSGTIQGGDIDPDGDEDIESNDEVEIPRGTWLTLPQGYEISQIRPEHPGTTYDMFKAEIVNEIARCVLMPYNVAAANSADYNYASGRLDHQKYHRFVETIRVWGQRRFLNRVASAFLTEAYLLQGFFETRPTFEQVMRAIRMISWFWPGFKHVDPVKEANAERIRLETGTTTLKDIYAEQGADYEKKLIQRGKELEKMKELGIPVPTSANLKIEDKDDDEASSKKSKSQKK